MNEHYSCCSVEQNDDLTSDRVRIVYAFVSEGRHQPSLEALLMRGPCFERRMARRICQFCGSPMKTAAFPFRSVGRLRKFDKQPSDLIFGRACCVVEPSG